MSDLRHIFERGKYLPVSNGGHHGYNLRCPLWAFPKNYTTSRISTVENRKSQRQGHLKNIRRRCLLSDVRQKFTKITLIQRLFCRNVYLLAKKYFLITILNIPRLQVDVKSKFHIFSRICNRVKTIKMLQEGIRCRSAISEFLNAHNLINSCKSELLESKINQHSDFSPLSSNCLSIQNIRQFYYRKC